MIILLIPTIINLLIFGILKNINIDLLNVVLILINYIITNILIIKMNSIRHKGILQLSFFVRMILMLFDLYGNSIFYLPTSGADSVGFYLTGLRYMNASIIKDNLYGGVYSKYIGLIFRFIGDKLIFVQYTNVLLSILTIIVLIKTFDLMSIDFNIEKKLIIILSFLPLNMIISSVNLRESLIVFFVSISLYYFINFFLYERSKFIINSLLSLIIASVFHSGVFFIVIGYIFAVFFGRVNKLSFNKIISIVSIIVLLIFTLANSDILLDKTSNVEITSIGSSESQAGSLYLPNIITNSIFKIFTLGWLKALYLYISPTPMYWRGINDILTFAFDSSIYIYLIGTTISNRRELFENNKKKLVLSLIISFLSVSLVFGVGTRAAGTAMRHRNKILPLILVLHSLIYSNTKKNQKLYRNE